MTHSVIQIDNLGKQFSIGSIQQSYRTIRETITDAFTAPFRRTFNLIRGQATGAADLNENIWALKDLSLNINNGEVIGIIGRNGAGKTTLLKILSRITEPSQGQAIIRGRVGSLLEVGTGFHPELTGRENVYLNGAILGMSRIEINKKFDEIVAFAEVEKFIDTPVKHYSTGMHVRLAFAVAAHMEPDILIVDEVLAVGDLQFQKKCLGKMEGVGHSGRTVLFVSHNMSVITKLCSRAILLDHGRLIADGPSAEIVAGYISDALGVSGGSVKWNDLNKSPGVNGFKLASMTLLDSNEKMLSTVHVEQDIYLRLGYHVDRPNLKFRCVAIFYTQGVCAFASQEATEIIHEKTGFYYSEVAIPGNILAEGEYTVGISVFASKGKKMHFCQKDDLVMFQVYDPITGNSARGDYGEGFAGVMRPLLAWKNEYLGSKLE